MRHSASSTTILSGDADCTLWSHQTDSGPQDFDYVVREQQKARVAFGSAQDRTVMPMAGLRGSASRLANLAMRATDRLPNLGPAEYATPNQTALYDVLTKVTSTRGVGPGARTAARFKDTDQHLPAPNAYQVLTQPPATPNKVPFNTNTYRRALARSTTPGPGAYTPGAFSQPGVPVAVRCGGGEGPGHCEGCLQDLQQGVEFWGVASAVPGLAAETVLCEACMAAARKQNPRDCRFTRWQLQAFQKTRDCSDVHRHEGTRAKIFLMEPAAVEKRRRKEKYLSQYFRDHRVIDRDYMPGTEPAKLTEGEPVRQIQKKDDFCCLHQAFNSFNKDQMSFGLRLPSELIYNTMKKCALDFQPSLSSSQGAQPSLAPTPRDARRSLIYNTMRKCALDFQPSLSSSQGAQPSLATSLATPAEA